MGYGDCYSCGRPNEPSPEELIEELTDEVNAGIDSLKGRIEKLQMFKDTIDANAECEYQFSENARLRRELDILKQQHSVLMAEHNDVVLRNHHIEGLINDPGKRIDKIAGKNRVFLLPEKSFAKIVEGRKQPMMIMSEIDLKTFKTVRHVGVESIVIMDKSKYGQ